MNIIAGEKRGARLASLEGRTTRPTAIRTREAVFNLISGGRYGRPLPGAVVIDLFAGTGALGLEALSRGASAASFIEKDNRALAVLRQNIIKLGYQQKCLVMAGDLTTGLAYHGEPAQLIFCDPPYDSGLADTALHSLAAQKALSPEALVIVETRKNETPQLPEMFAPADTRRYGMAQISLFFYRG